MAVLTSLKADTAQNLQLDAGVIMAGDLGDMSNFDPSSKTAQIIGATKGGAQFSAVPEIRSLLDGIDGTRGNYKDANVIDSWDITLKTTVSTVTKENIIRACATGAESSTGGPYAGTKITPSMTIESSIYKDIAWVGTVGNKTKPMVILLKNAMNMNGFNFTAEDKNTGTIEMEFKAHFDLASPTTVPFEIYTPLK